MIFYDMRPPLPCHAVDAQVNYPAPTRTSRTCAQLSMPVLTDLSIHRCCLLMLCDPVQGRGWWMCRQLTRAEHWLGRTALGAPYVADALADEQLHARHGKASCHYAARAMHLQCPSDIIEDCVSNAKSNVIYLS